MRDPLAQHLIVTVRENKHVAATVADENMRKQYEQAAAQEKRRLGAFLFQANFDETPAAKSGRVGRWRKQSAARLTGLVVMDIDHLDNPRTETARWTWRQGKGTFADLCASEDIWLVYVTPSGLGLKVVFRARREWGNLIDNQHRMAERLGVEIDESCKDASRLSFICTEKDILYINTQKLFTYEDEDYDKEFGPQYRENNSRPTRRPAVGARDGGTVAGGNPAVGAGTGAGTAGQADRQGTAPAQGAAAGGERVGSVADGYHGVPYAKIIEAWLQQNGGSPRAGDRHNTALRLASDLRNICDYDPRLLAEVLLEAPFVKAIAHERGQQEVERLAEDACNNRQNRWRTRRLKAALVEAGVKDADGDEQNAADEEAMYRSWSERLEPLLSPGLREAVEDVPPLQRPCAALTAMAMYGTLMTRTWYDWWDGERTRLNYAVYIIGDPASGKSFAARQDKYIMEVMRSQDQVVRDAVALYKEQRAERATSSKAQKGEALKEPQGIIRYLPSRTSNAVFFKRTKNAREEQKDGTLLPLHLYTFDAELGANNAAQRGGSWIDKRDLELKAFHNELTGVDYANADSVNENINVFWNTVYTGTPVSLHKKFTMENINDGLCSRVAICRMFPQPFVMLEKQAKSVLNAQAMREWGFRLDTATGPLDCQRLVDFCYDYTARLAIDCEVENDRVRDYLRKRIGFYGMNMALPRCVMRQWDEWRKTHTLTIDQSDLDFAALCMDIILEMQDYYFGQMLQESWDNAERDMKPRRRQHHSVALYEQLAQEFKADDVAKVFGLKTSSAYVQVNRWLSDGLIEKTDVYGQYRKVSSTLKI